MSRLQDLIDELCPDGVEYKTLGEVAPFVRERANTGEAQFDAYVGVDALLQDKMGRDLTKTDIPDGRHIYFKPGDTLLGNIRPYLKKVWFADCPGGTNGDVLVFRAKEGVDQKYLYYVISSDDFFIYDNGKAKGSKMPRGDKEAIRKYRLPVPPIEVQREIVSILDSFQELDDVLTTEIEAREKQFETSMALLMNRTFASYSTDKLGSLMTVVRGASPRPIKKYMATAEEGVHWIKIGDVGVGGKFITDTAEYVTQEGADKSRLLKRGSFVLSNSMSFGRPYILDIDGCIHDGWLALSEYEETFNRDFLYYLLRSDQVQMVWRMVASNSTVRNLNSDIVRDTDVPIPAMSDQEHVATVLNEIFALIDCLREERDARRKQFEYYRDRLLAFPEKVA